MAESGRSVTALVPTRTQGLTQLNDLAEVIQSYATARNYADGLTTSHLSPYIRRRLILEEEVFAFALTVGGYARIEKFAQEVVWRTYWKGWLAARPSVWTAYLTRLRTLDETLPGSAQDHVASAIAGTTNLPYFNAWCDELKSTGYLHNHERMWFASVWIFTLRLPWEMGARFFLDHLLDGDPASNTLSWRWVAGLQTPGKHYLARADNISKYTNGRWVPKPGELNESADAIRDDGLARIPAVKPALGPDAGQVQPRAVLLHDEDCGPLPDSWAALPAVRFVVTDRLQHCPSKLVDEWIAGACADAEARVGTVTLARSEEEVTDWCRVNGMVEVWAFRPLTGFVGDALAVLATGLATAGIKLHYADRGHDITFFPMATRGFFPFWEAASVTLRRRRM
jgi:deoxyribodipyrimidine photo-lyase